MKKIAVLLGIIGLSCISINNIYAADFSGYKTVAPFEEKKNTVPKIVEVTPSIPNSFVIADDKGNVVPIQKQDSKTIVVPEKVTACKNLVCGDAKALSDGVVTTTYDFSLDKEGVNTGSVVITYKNPITTNKVSFETTGDSYKPKSFSLYADGKLILNTTANNIVFPLMTGKEFTILFQYDQPIRFTEVGVGYDVVTSSRVRFVYVPNTKYLLYTDPMYGAVSTGSSPANLFDVKEPYEAIALREVTANPAFKELDSDDDGVSDGKDNCPIVYNPDQKSTYRQGVGDACGDYDYDGYLDSKDNCPAVYNPDQKDSDGNGVGDACGPKESRFTEKYPWLPWLAIGVVFLVILGMGYSVYSSKKAKEVTS